VKKTGIVVIGRNEGSRLENCLKSVLGQGDGIVYVDSGSSDGSVELAQSLGVNVVDLDLSIPFTAGRARNVGFRQLCSLHADFEWIQFIDGDSSLAEGWLKTGIQFLQNNPTYAVVAGRVRELNRDESIYNRLMDVEWCVPVGDSTSCGGIALMRRTAFEQVSGFNTKVIAGEEPELCYRLRREGWGIMRLNAEMAMHDSAMTRFAQWWKRSLRSGYGGLGVYQRCKEDSPRPFERSIKSARYWVAGWPALVLVSSFLGYVLGSTSGFICGLLISLSVLPIQIIRIALKQWRSGLPWPEALGYAVLIMIAKVPEFLGQIRLFLENRRGIEASLVEHKI
jgi:GT2 family glycosyltransferase